MTTNDRLENAFAVIVEHLGDSALLFVDRTDGRRDYVRLLPLGCREPIARALLDQAETKDDAEQYDRARMEGDYDQ